MLRSTLLCLLTTSLFWKKQLQLVVYAILSQASRERNTTRFRYLFFKHLYWRLQNTFMGYYANLYFTNINDYSVLIQSDIEIKFLETYHFLRTRLNILWLNIYWLISALIHKTHLGMVLKCLLLHYYLHWNQCYETWSKILQGQL